MASSALIVVAGGGVGLLYGLFGVGSAFATPVLSLLGVPGMAAVVGPLPALLPGSAAGAWTYTRHGKVDWTIARRTLAGAVPAAVAGAAMSRLVGGPLLLLLSGAVLLAVGIRIVRGVEAVGSGARADARRNSIVFVVTSAAAVGFVSGLLANGGGFLLVPLLLVVLGLDMHEAAGTSLVVAVALTVPTIITHAFLGDLEWMLSLWFALGLVPGALAGARVAQRLPTARLKTLFGVLLVGFALWFLARQGLAYLG